MILARQSPALKMKLRGGMRVLHIHDVAETLREKGLSGCRLKSSSFVAQNSPTSFWIKTSKSTCLPCKINVYTKDRQTFISGMRPIILSQFFPQADLGERPQEIDHIIQNIINNAQQV